MADLRDVERIAALEADARNCRDDRRDIWMAVNELRHDAADTRANTAATLEIVRGMAEDQKTLKEDVRILIEAKAISDGAHRRTATLVALISAAVSGLGTYFASHFLGAAK